MAAKAVKKEPGVRMVRVKIPRAGKDEENFALVTVNDRTWKIRKGEWVEVPYYVAEVIEASERMQDVSAAFIDEKAYKAAD